jgi:Mg2+/Co2+ transporter CorB
VDEIMRHRAAIEMIDASAPATEIMRLILDSPHTRHPLYKDDPENIVGILHAKDFLRAMQRMLDDDGRIDPEELAAFDILDVAMPPYFIPDTTALDDQMRAFLKRKSHFALVVDEYGALQGLITLEDILEEIVGEIADEFDIPTEDPVARTPDGAFIVPGGMTIRDLNRHHDWTFPDDEANTIAGLVIHEAQSIPAEGQVFSFHGFRFEVLEKQDNRIATLKIKPL